MRNEVQATDDRTLVGNICAEQGKFFGLSDGKLCEGLGTRLDKRVQTTHDERGMDICITVKYILHVLKC